MKGATGRAGGAGNPYVNFNQFRPLDKNEKRTDPPPEAGGAGVGLGVGC